MVDRPGSCSRAVGGGEGGWTNASASKPYGSSSSLRCPAQVTRALRLDSSRASRNAEAERSSYRSKPVRASESSIQSPDEHEEEEERRRGEVSMKDEDKLATRKFWISIYLARRRYLILSYLPEYTPRSYLATCPVHVSSACAMSCTPRSTA